MRNDLGAVHIRVRANFRFGRVTSVKYFYYNEQLTILRDSYITYLLLICVDIDMKL